MMNGSKLPHSLRLVIFLLRLALGLNFFYLGFSTLFNVSLGRELQERSLGSLYGWLNNPLDTSPLHTYFAWAFLVIGGCLLVGLVTRSAAITGIILTLISFMPNISYATLGASQFINDEVLILICLLILVFSNAGVYLGVDKFIHIHFSSKHKK
jgi:uncharacterized membrane protein YphA (DoxX/SURF4 family)